MLRFKTKEECVKVLEKVDFLCKKGIQKDETTLITVLQDAQDAVIMVGERLEKEAENVGEIILQMERLCELFYLLSQNMGERSLYSAQISGTLEEIITSVEKLHASYQVVFFPYKAEMWDSLESVWMACEEDPLCDCRVVPIPYYSFDSTKGCWDYRYEIDRFPSYVPVVHYSDYDLGECADAAFIHNPYDDCNYVTRVFSDYFSHNLKKYVKKLFYISYYVSAGGVSNGKALLPGFLHADHIMVQSEQFKEGMKEYDHYRKAEVVGSPKLDRVIRMCRKGGEVPADWKMVLDGKKSLMLNTSINAFLKDGEAYLEKLKDLFGIVKDRKDVAIVWRPHPLLKSTIESMRPHLLGSYLELQRLFIEEKAGVLDDTPDVTNTVAITDGYIGEAESSVTTLFEVAGKPLFILNNYVTDVLSTEESQSVYISDCEKVGDDYWMVALDSSNLLVANAHYWDRIRRATSICGPKWSVSNSKLLQKENKLYFAKDFYTYNMDIGKIEKISDNQSDEKTSYRAIISYRDKVFYLPNQSKCIAEYHVVKKTWKKHEKPILALQKNATTTIYEGVYGYCVQDKYIWITNLYSNVVLRFNMETSAFQTYALGDSSCTYSSVASNGKKLYLSEARTGVVSEWDLSTMRCTNRFTMPDGWINFPTYQGRWVAHSSLVLHADSLIAIPRYSNALVRINLNAQEITILAEELWQDVLIPKNSYNPQVHATTTFAKLIDGETLLIQKRRDAALLELNLRTWEYQVQYPCLADGEMARCLDGEDGFEKINTNAIFARRESRYFSFEGFLDDLVNDRLGDAMERQKEAMKTVAVNLDGTCGEKIHEFMMKVLTKEPLSLSCRIK